MGQYYNGFGCVNCGAYQFSVAGDQVCTTCPLNTYKLDPSYYLTNSGFESDILQTCSYYNMTPSGWYSTGTVAVVSSSCSALGGMSASQGLQFGALRFAGSSLSQVVDTENSTSYNLIFYASNRPSSTGVVAPLLVSAYTLVAAVTPAAGAWTLYQFQFASNKSTSFQLLFQIGTANSGDVMIFLDNVTLVSSSCEDCIIDACDPGMYFLGGGFCGSSASCIPCPMGYFCAGGTSQPQACPAGTYNSNTSSFSSSDCEPCLSSCNAGYFLINECASIANFVAASCALCPSHFYCEGGSVLSATPCPMFTSSLPGSSSLQQCETPTFGR